VLLRAREQARLGAISRIDQRDTPPQSPYTYGGVFAAHTQGAKARGANTRGARARKADGARSAGARTAESDGASRVPATSQRCLCEVDRWGFDSHTTGSSAPEKRLRGALSLHARARALRARSSRPRLVLCSSYTFNLRRSPSHTHAPPIYPHPHTRRVHRRCHRRSLAKIDIPLSKRR
jgi:hypothetical protein